MLRQTVSAVVLLAACGLAEEPATPTTTPTTPVVTMHELQTQLKLARPGDLVQTPFVDLATIRRVEFTKAKHGSAQFLFSDKPEYFRTGDGISMQEEVQPGTVRLYLYHVPEPSGAKKVISAVIENLSDAPMQMNFDAYASPKPSGDYHRMAREALAAYLGRAAAPQDIAKRTLPPHGRAVIDPKIDSAVVTKDILVHTLHEFSIDRPARITVFQRDPAADSLKVIDTLPKLPRVLPGWHDSGAGRGLFPGDYTCANDGSDIIDTADGPRVFVVADGKTDPWVQGRDSLDPSAPILNKGNYGVMYHVTLHYKSTDGRGMAVLMSGHRPDNKYCKYTVAAIKINAGLHPGGVVQLPTKERRFENLPQAVLMQTYPPAKPGEPATIDFTYSPPGACCLPTPIVLIPIDN